VGASLVAGALMAAPPAEAAIPGCTVAALSALGVSGVTITSATDVAATTSAPEYCHVLGSVASPSGNPNRDGFALDLPASWSGRFLMSGGGGFAGSVAGANPAALSKGFAVASTDTGHRGGDASWAITAPHVPAQGAVTDYYHLAVHNVTVVGKQLATSFYRGSISYAYFQGCSTGGRQALVAAERYPDDFDGIIAGDAFMTHRLVLQQLKGELALLEPPTAFLSASQVAAIDAAVYADCDARDGVQDNLIQNPQACEFEPKRLLCGKSGNVAPSCLTQDQVDTVKNYIRPITDHKGRLVLPGYPVSDLAGSDGMAVWFLGSAPPVNFTGPQPWTSPPFSWFFADQTLKYLVFQDPNFNTFDFGLSNTGVIDSGSLAIYDQMTAAGNADDAEALRAYLNRGKKLIIYHGFSDGGLSPFPMIQFYKDLAQQTPKHFEGLQQNARLFMVPGMHHCSGGPGPNVFDTLTPLQQWVENDVPPNGIIATHFVGNNRNNPVDRTMPLCMFPQQARYSGHGDKNNAANWSCPDGDEKLLKIGKNGSDAGL
jgi:feruloyl esterase